MKIVAFLQNMWVLPSQVDGVSRWGATSPQRERMIHYALFAGCLTGRRLRQYLGEELCSEIKWQEANPTIADNPRDYFPPDRMHIGRVFMKHQPDLVLCFTKRGEKEVREMCSLLWMQVYVCSTSRMQTERSV